jgi:tetratricopeptide (TPR) repeat protein
MNCPPALEEELKTDSAVLQSDAGTMLSVRTRKAMRPCRYKRLALLCIFLLAGCYGERSTTLEDGVSLFLRNDLDSARPVLARAVENDPGDPDVQAWYAECLRRLGRYDLAAEHARAAVDLAPGHSFAHTVLGDLFSPRLSSWQRANAESAWVHLMLAVAADPGDGNAWTSVWIHSMRRGDREMEHRAAVSMIESGFLTPSLLAYNRWQLRHLPPKAVLLTNGDMDTYPSVALQENEGFRDDVAVINLSLLNLPWYARDRASRFGIPLPFAEDELARLRPYVDINGETVTQSARIVAGWLEMQKRGEFARPLCAAVTLARFDFTPDALSRRVFRGSYYEYLPRPAGRDADLLSVETSLSGLRPADFEGEFVSDSDRSPVRRSGTFMLARNITAAMVRYVNLLIENGRLGEAKDALDEAEHFDSRIRAGGHFKDEFERLRQIVES